MSFNNQPMPFNHTPDNSPISFHYESRNSDYNQMNRELKCYCVCCIAYTTTHVNQCMCELCINHKNQSLTNVSSTYSPNCKCACCYWRNPDRNRFSRIGLNNNRGAFSRIGLNNNRGAFNRIGLNNNRGAFNRFGLNNNRGAIHLLETNQYKIDCDCLSSNPAGMHLLETNQYKIDCNCLSSNPAGMHLLETNQYKID